MPPKKVVFNPFKSQSRIRNIDPPDDVIPEEVKLGEFRDATITFSPAIPKAEAQMTIEFRCTTRLARGDNITIRLPGFKGPAQVFQLEPRPHPEGKSFVEYFQAYWSGEDQPKGAAPPQVIILQVQQAIEENVLVVLGVPNAVQIQLPEKLGANSPKLKIEGNVKHAEGGKIAKQSFASSNEIKKRPVEEEIAELDVLVKNFSEGPHELPEELRNVAQEISREEVDQIWEAARDRLNVAIGLQWKIELQAHRSFEESGAALAKIVTENCYALSKKRGALALHKEIAENLGVKVSKVVLLEDALYTFHGSYYPNLCRSAIFVLRLFTMESLDLMRVFGLLSAPCIYREIQSAIRSTNVELLTRWQSFIATLMTTTSKTTNVDPQLIPVLYRAIKDLPPDQLQIIAKLKKDSWYMFPGFTIAIPEAKHMEEGYICPDGGVVFEIHGVVDAVELCDVSNVPEDQEWLLPMFSSFRVVSVEVLPERNHLTRVVLQMVGSLAGALRDEAFPESERSLASVVVKKSRSDAEASSERTQAIAQCIYATLALQERRAQHPLYLLHAQYLQQFAETRRASVARTTVEEGVVRWQQCTAEATVGSDGVMRPASWETINKRNATTIELCFLRRTRALKLFNPADGVAMVNFSDWTVDIGGKGAKKLRRMIGKLVSHQSPPPVILPAA